ncbi:MAG: 1-acyl-sn-glycerol-3-phosphate acyltransferase [Deltaproteobacteria bacterium]|nr:1-acyl-sn-glycerol-3-phosphate acyltransferase [Deltaproteobacteria bacterium]
MPDLTITRQTLDLEKVIAEKNPALLTLIPNFVIRYLKRIIHVDEMNEGLYRLRDQYGLKFIKAALDMFQLKVDVRGIENISNAERCIVVANHPLGGLDGMALMHVVGKVRKDLVVPVNDILMNIPNIRELFTPINKHGSNLSNLRTYDDAFASDRTVIHFPAGLCSRRKGGRIRDLRWHKSFIAKARKHRKDVVPVFIGGQNSSFFYTLANLRRWFSIGANIEMLYLVDEMYKQRDKVLPFIIGKPIPYKTFNQRHDDWTWTRKVKYFVYRLQHAESAIFNAGQK